MNFTVDWLPAVEQELANLWVNAPDRDAVTRASHLLDQQLESDPGGVGESRPNGRRICFATPLGITYRVFVGERRVVVIHVWRFKTR